MSQPNPAHSELDALAYRCAQETNLFFQRRSYDPYPCMALFRQAFLYRDDQAWERLYQQYVTLVRSWVSQHRQFRLCGEEPDVFVLAAFEKMWQAITPERFEHFRDLASLLGYLKMCAHSTVVDYARASQRRQLTVSLDPQKHAPEGPDAEAHVLQTIDAGELWRYVEQVLQNEGERVVIYESFIWALNPRQIWQRHREHFATIQDIYNAKRNALARLERSEGMKRWR